MHLEEHERQRLRLSGCQSCHGAPPLQEEQRGEILEGVEGLDAGADQAEEQHEQGKAPARRLEQLVEEER